MGRMQEGGKSAGRAMGGICRGSGPASRMAALGRTSEKMNAHFFFPWASEAVWVLQALSIWRSAAGEGDVASPGGRGGGAAFRDRQDGARETTAVAVAVPVPRAAATLARPTRVSVPSSIR